jgi:hypothetical protein
MHDSCVVVSLLKAIPIVLTAKIFVILPVAKGLAPWASVWCGGEWQAHFALLASATPSARNDPTRLPPLLLSHRRHHCHRRSRKAPDPPPSSH